MKGVEGSERERKKIGERERKFASETGGFSIITSSILGSRFCFSKFISKVNVVI